MVKTDGIKKKLIALGLTVGLATAGAVISEHEGLVLGTYVDPVGILTSCYGNTGLDSSGEKLQRGKVYTESECLMQLAGDLVHFEKDINRLVKVPISNKERAAYISFIYNVGVNNFKSSTLLKKLNSGDRTAACNELSKWVYAKGFKLPGLIKRREKEKEMCLDGAASRDQSPL